MKKKKIVTQNEIRAFLNLRNLSPTAIEQIFQGEDYEQTLQEMICQKQIWLLSGLMLGLPEKNCDHPKNKVLEIEMDSPGGYFKCSECGYTWR